MELTSTSSIDRAGQLKAQIAELKKEFDAITDAVKDAASLSGQKHFEGELFKATYIESNRSTVDYKALCADLGITPEQIAKYTKTEAVFTVKVTGR